MGAYDPLNEYYGLLDGRQIPDLNTPRFRCPKHEHMMCIVVFRFNGTESVRIWRCPLAGCKEEKITIGEDYKVYSDGMREER
jgi:hypothetical protein